MDESPNFPDSNLNVKDEPENEENQESSNNLSSSEEEEEENNDNDNNNNNEENNDDSLSLDIDEDRYTLPQIREFLKKKRLKSGKKSLLPKKQITQNIVFDAKTNSLQNCFIPDLTQLKVFLDNCVVKEIIEEEPPSLIKEQKQKVFDPQEFMLSNGIFKNSLSVEDLSLVEQKNKEENFTELFEEKQPLILREPKMESTESSSTTNYKSDLKKVKEQYTELRKIMSSDKLSPGQKKWLSDFIKTTSALPLEEIKKTDDKFDIVFDLDNTCVFSSMLTNEKEGLDKKSDHPEKLIKTFQFDYNDKTMFASLIFREKLKEFIDYVKDLANFHISTLAIKNYGEAIKQMLEDLCGIKFIRFFSRRTQKDENNDIKSEKKYLKDLTPDLKYHVINENNAIIFDDSVNVWPRESFNVIASKKFFDKDLKVSARPNSKYSDFEIFLNTYTPFTFNQFKNEGKSSWTNQEIAELKNCPFYKYKDKNSIKYNESYLAEYSDSSKFQFVYMKNVIKVLYCLVFHNDLTIVNAIKLVRLNALNGKKFFLKYLAPDQNNFLTEIIKVCGGEVYYPPLVNEEYILNVTQKIFLVVSQTAYTKNKNEILKDLNEHGNYIMINEKFILDSYYFMTDLEDSYKDKEYVNFED